MKFNPYSVSKLGTYNHCPKQFEFKYVKKVKIPFTMNIALYKGSHIHQILEHNFDYNTKFSINNVYTEEYYKKTLEIVKSFEYSKIGQKYKKLIPIANLEEDFAFNTKMELVSFKSKDAWIRGSADLYLVRNTTAYIWDYKSGKDHSSEEDFGITQSKCYAIYMFIKFPEVQNVKAIFVFVEHSTEKEIVYTRDKFNDYVKDFYKMTKKVESDTFYEPNVSVLCGWCDYGVQNICLEPKFKEENDNSFMKSKITF